MGSVLVYSPSLQVLPIMASSGLSSRTLVGMTIQNAVEAVIKIHPLLSLIWIPFLGPIVEEFTYRFGLFNALNKINRIFAYVVVSLIFGLIHFNFFAPNIAVELLNLPPYIISGLIFSYIYDRENLATSIVAHVTNNLVSYLAMIFYMITQ